MSNLYPARWRQDPQTLGRGGEVALVILAAVLLALALAALVGVGVAGALFGGGWVWPHGTQGAGHELHGLLTGDAADGLPPALARRAPGRTAVNGCVVAAELIAVLVLGTAAVLVARYRQPGDARGGMATRSQAGQVLGASRVRSAATIIRPDLHARRRGAPLSRGGAA
jgi:hypothetical protein